MNIHEYIKTNGVTIEVNSLGTYQVVHVAFDNNGTDDETSFDIKGMCTKTGNNMLSELYKDFCRENRLPTNTVTGIAIVASARTKQELQMVNL